MIDWSPKIELLVSFLYKKNIILSEKNEEIQVMYLKKPSAI